MKTKTAYITAGSLIVILLFAIDQITKYLALTYLAGTSGISLIPGVFDLYYLENRGAAFGMLNNCQFVFILIAVIIILFAVYVYLRMPAGQYYYPLRAVCIMIIAGAAGNMTDRLVRGYVIDFLYFTLIDFPVFNVADCYVCIGAALTILLLFTIYRTEEFSFLNFHRD